MGGTTVVVALVIAGSVDAPLLMLQYERGPTACPTADAFRDLVAARLGRDPFVEDAADIATVRFQPKGSQVSGTVDLKLHEASSSRSLAAPFEQCDALADSIALALAIALESPPSPPAPPRPPPPPIVEGPRTTPAVIVPPPARPVEPSELRVAAVLGATGAAGLTPGLSLGVEGGVLVRGATWGLQIGGRVHTVPGTVVLDERDPVDATVLTARVLGCGHLDPWALCLVADAGSFRSRVRSAKSPGAISTFVAVAGARVAYGVPLSPRFTARIAVELLVNLVQTELVLDETAIWSAPPIAGVATVAIMANIL